MAGTRLLHADIRASRCDTSRTIVGLGGRPVEWSARDRAPLRLTSSALQHSALVDVSRNPRIESGSVSITEASQRPGLSRYTLRYYERADLIQPVGRSPSGQRKLRGERPGLVCVRWSDCAKPGCQSRRCSTLLGYAPAGRRHWSNDGSCSTSTDARSRPPLLNSRTTSRHCSTKSSSTRSASTRTHHDSRVEPRPCGHSDPSCSGGEGRTARPATIALGHLRCPSAMPTTTFRATSQQHRRWSNTVNHNPTAAFTTLGDVLSADIERARYQRGAEILAQVDGAGSQKAIESLGDVAPTLAHHVVAYGFGDVYARPGLTPPQRQLATLGMLTALAGCEPRLHVPVNASLNVGLTASEIVEAITHAAVYCGSRRHSTRSSSPSRSSPKGTCRTSPPAIRTARGPVRRRRRRSTDVGQTGPDCPPSARPRRIRHHEHRTATAEPRGSRPISPVSTDYPAIHHC